MLILTRSIGESIFIGKDKNSIKVTLLNVKGTIIKIGFQAPRKIPIYRKEVYERILDERRIKAAEKWWGR